MTTANETTANRQSSPIHQDIGTIRAVVGEKLTVEMTTGSFAARRALTCLLLPRPGDSVLLAVPDEGALFVLAILERDDAEAPNVLQTAGDLELAVGGELKMTGMKGVVLRSPTQIDIGTRELSVTAVDSEIKSDRFRFFGRMIHVQASTVKAILGTMDSVLDRFSQTVKRSYRFVEELDLTRAEEIDMRSNQTLTMRAKNTFVAAEELVKVDGKQIHLG